VGRSTQLAEVEAEAAAARINRKRYERALLSREAECERNGREQVTPTPTS
jgi:hypothetical protein